MANTVSGILKLMKKGSGILRDPTYSLRPGPDDVWVPAQLIRQYDLVEGVTVTGSSQSGKKGPRLVEIESICGLTPEAFKAHTPFSRLIAVDPCERFNLGLSGEMSMRVIDLIAPIGKGTRGLIVAPPKAGKTTLLEQLAGAIRANDPNIRIIVLLIDERPEEVTLFRRTVDAEVIASSSDQKLKDHIELSELMLAHIRTELECGYDVVVLVDSLTRMSRTFNLRGSGRGRGRTLSGGMEAGAIEIPRRFFGLARNIEHGGSVTIIATALIDTGSRMDDFIYEEFKGTGNSEVVLNRDLSEARIFPALDLSASSTRKEYHLYSPEDSQRLAKLRRELSLREPKEALISLIELLEKFPTNEAFLQSIPLT